jgi:carbon-monoxide dehydrogenase medium subunit
VVTGPGETCLASDEFVVEFELDRMPSRSADAYLRMIPRTEMDIAVVGAGARVVLSEDGTITDAAVALGAVAPTVVRVPAAEEALVGTLADDDTLVAVAAAASDACNPIDDKRGTIDYRKQVAGVLAKRAVLIAIERAGQRNGDV